MRATAPESPWATLPNRLTLARLGSVPLLWLVAAAGHPLWLAVGVALAAGTDVVDGPLARLTGRTTALGSRLDSIADHLLTASTALWLVWLRPDFVREQLTLLAAWAVLGIAALAVGWARFRRVGDLHLFSAKAAGFLGYALAVWILAFGTYSQAAFRLVFAVACLAAVETLVALATRDSVDEHLGSLLLARRGRAGRNSRTSGQRLRLPPD